MLQDDPLWYRDAIIYQLHVRCFFDENGDGIGDFAGLTRKLDYIQELGVTAIWLLPFYPSPLRDDGYDIADYSGVHEDYGTMRDFRAFVRAAHARGLRVITELVINHTSDQHPWFQAARRSPPGSAKREMYVWSDTDEKFPETRIIFTDTESSNWQWDAEAQAYYWHRFFSHQPDLNHNNPRVVRAVIKVMRKWLDAGVDGLRLDAIPYLCVREGTNNENLPETHQVLKQLRAAIDANYSGRMLLAEANQWPEDVIHYFGDSDECHMAFHFPLMPRIYMAVAMEDRQPITGIMDQTPALPEGGQWAIFLRNHDELTLEMVTDRERDSMYRHYAHDPRMRCNVGIRRRLAPLMDNDRRKIELLSSLLMSMPGTPILYYGDELGMGDNIFLGDRNGVRTPMQWTGDRNGGFSSADPARLYLPSIQDPVYGYAAVNAEAQARSPSSLLNWTRGIMAVRKQHQAFGRGSISFLHPRNSKILAYLRQHEQASLLCVANLSASPQPVELDLGQFSGRVPVELTGNTTFPRVGELPYLLTLPAYGFYWFLLVDEAEDPFEAREAPTELPYLVIPDGWSSLLEGPGRRRLEEDLLPAWIGRQAWFQEDPAALERASIGRAQLVGEGEESWLAAVARTKLGWGGTEDYSLPLSLIWDEEGERLLQECPDRVIARVRHHARVGVLADAFADDAFCRFLVSLVHQNEELPLGQARLRGFTTGAFAAQAEELPAVRRLEVERSNTTLVVGELQVLKGIRRLSPGPNSELDLGRHLTEVAHFPNTPPLEGGLVLEQPDHEPTTVALVLGFSPNQGDGWDHSRAYLERAAERWSEGEDPGFVDDAAESPAREEHAAYLALARTMGLRTGQLHRALGADQEDPAFQPEQVGKEEQARWGEVVAEDAVRVLAHLEDLRGDGDLDGDTGDLAADLLDRREDLAALIRELTPRTVALYKTRFHGDFRLGQVLVVSNHDVQIIDFEGEAARHKEARPDKHSPLRDVAGMLRSLGHAAAAARQGLGAGLLVPELAVEAWLRRWEAATARAFLEGYEEGAAGGPGFPEDPDLRSGLIRLFCLEKALYELSQALDRAPDNLSDPLAGVLSLLEE